MDIEDGEDKEKGLDKSGIITGSNTEVGDMEKTVTASSSGGSKKPTPRKRGRPRLTEEEKIQRQLEKQRKLFEEGKMKIPRSHVGRPKLEEILTPEELERRKEIKRIKAAEYRRKWYVENKEKDAGYTAKSKAIHKRAVLAVLEEHAKR